MKIVKNTICEVENKLPTVCLIRLEQISNSIEALRVLCSWAQHNTLSEESIEDSKR